MQLQPLEAFLHPPPILLVLLLGECAYLWVLLRIALEDAWADQVSGIAHRMHERLRIVDDKPA